MNSNSETTPFTVITDPTDDEVKEFQKGLEAYNMEQTDGEFNSPKDWLSLVLKDHDGNIVGGIMTSTLYWAQYLEVLWVDDKYRGLGYGRDLVLEAERLAKKNGCLASQTYTFSFQAPDFYQAVGYKLIATYDGYFDGITELILMKRLDTIDDASTRKVDPLDLLSLLIQPTNQRRSLVMDWEGTLMSKLVICLKNIHKLDSN